MNLFFLKTTLMGLLVGVTALVCWHITDNGQAASTNGWAAIIDKHYCAETTGASTIWLVGGSNAMFGYDSERLSVALNRPVINMGLGAALGLPFILNEASAVAKSGDIVVLSLEYNLRDGDYNAQLFASDFYPPARNYIQYPNPMTWLRTNAYHQLRRARAGLNSLLYNNSATAKQPSTSDTVNVYFRQAFSKQGDMISHLNNQAPRQVDFAKQQDYLPYSAYVDRINTFIKASAQRGIDVYFIFPPLAQSSYQPNKRVFRKWQLEIKHQLEAPILTTPTNSVYVDSLFFDTIYHLNQTGRDQHTQALLVALEPFVNTKKKDRKQSIANKANRLHYSRKLSESYVYSE